MQWILKRQALVRWFTLLQESQTHSILLQQFYWCVFNVGFSTKVNFGESTGTPLQLPTAPTTTLPRHLLLQRPLNSCQFVCELIHLIGYRSLQFEQKTQDRTILYLLHQLIIPQSMMFIWEVNRRRAYTIRSISLLDFFVVYSRIKCQQQKNYGASKHQHKKFLSRLTFWFLALTFNLPSKNLFLFTHEKKSRVKEYP